MDRHTNRKKDGRTGGRTDITKITGAFHDYAESPATYSFIYLIDKLAPAHVQSLEVAL